MVIWMIHYSVDYRETKVAFCEVSTVAFSLHILNKTKQNKTRQDKTRQDMTRQDKTRQDKTRRDETRQIRDRDETKTRQRRDKEETKTKTKTKTKTRIRTRTKARKKVKTKARTKTRQGQGKGRFNSFILKNWTDLLKNKALFPHKLLSSCTGMIRVTAINSHHVNLYYLLFQLIRIYHKYIWPYRINDF